ncbi:MAG TPA: MFS transporter [Steroidobacteraceae bacterium]|jgi:MFS family permease|nr:MFS transporter [Steroidobacteraceae bacterium]
MKKYPRPTHIVLAVLALMYFITYLDRVNVSTAADGFGKDFSLSKTQIGLVFSFFAYPYLIFQIIGGWVSDRFGARRTLIACGIIWSAGTALTGMAGGLVSLLAARLLLGFGEGATFPAATSAMSRWVIKEQRGFAQGVTHAASRIGNAVAPPVIAFIMAATHGWRAAFYVCALISFAWVALWALTFTEHPKDHTRVTAMELAALPPSRAQIATAVPWSRLTARMLPVTIVYFCYGWTLWLYLSWIPQYFLHSQNLDLKNSGLFSAAVFFAGVVGDTLGGIVTDRLLKRTERLEVARSYMVCVCMFMSLVSLVPLMFTHSLGVSLACLSAGFFFAELTIGPMWAIPMDISVDHSGTASGIMNIGSAAAAIISPVVAGYLIDVSGNWQLPFVGSMILMGLGLVLSLRMHPERKFVTALAPEPS